VRERLGVQEALDRWLREHTTQAQREEARRLIDALLEGLSD
jgi:hypothetical protein